MPPDARGSDARSAELTAVEILGVSGELLDEPHSAQEPMRTTVPLLFWARLRQHGTLDESRFRPCGALPAFIIIFLLCIASATSAVSGTALSDVRLLPGSAFEAAFRTNQLSEDALVGLLLLTFRLLAGQRWPAGSLRLMGWEHTGSEYVATGHWLSSAAMSYAATGDTKLAEALATCSARSRSASLLVTFPPSSELPRSSEAITPVWAPYYCHTSCSRACCR